MARRGHRRPTGHTILVVDDQDETLLSLRSLLERDGYRVLTASCGDDALTVLKENEVHLLLVDYFMPRMNGAQLVREIRAFDPYVQIILQTGCSGPKPPQVMLDELDIQGYHDKADGPDKLLMWVTVGLKAYRLIHDLRERERQQGELVANVSHELRTPLNVIGGYAELLSEGMFGALPEQAAQPVRAVIHAARNLTDLVSDFLQYAKLEAGMCETKRTWTPLRDLARELERLGTLLLEEKDVHFSVEIPEVPPGLSTDTIKLRTVLRNLVTNAAKFTPRGSIAVRIRERDGGLEFVVQDTGPGIRAEDQELIFEPFRQADSSSTRAHGGIGLGLALSRKYARLLGGDLTVESAVGAGSVFTLFLPPSAVVEDVQGAAPTARAAAA